MTEQKKPNWKTIHDYLWSVDSEINSISNTISDCVDGQDSVFDEKLDNLQGMIQELGTYLSEKHGIVPSEDLEIKKGILTEDGDLIEI